MILLIDPHSALLQRSNILSEYPELDDAGPDTPGVGGDDDVSFALLGRSEGYDLPVRLPLRYQETVTPVDEDTDLTAIKVMWYDLDISYQVLGTDPEIFSSDGDLGPRWSLSRGDPVHDGWRTHL